jgi:small-conductance mechanosensitive channel/CRP-like cAMP-binding protein
MSFLYVSTLLGFVGLVVTWALSFVLEHRIGARFKDVARMVRGLLLPCVLALWLVDGLFGYGRESGEFKTVETIFGFSVVWFVAATVQAFFLADAQASAVRSRTPRLLVDIVRLCFVIIGMVMVYSGVWQKDVSPLLTTFGVGSLVLGLALQDTLGNLFAGLALIFERPLTVGDWVQLGDAVGKVRQITWRSVRIVTRELNEITIPNSAISKDRIMNYSSPNRLYGFKVTVGFSYDAPPSIVKEMLRTTALETPGIVGTPPPDARTLEFAASSITYELRVFIEDYDQFTDIRNDLMSRLWYSARRACIQIPYPITTIHKTEIPYQVPKQDDAQRLKSMLRSTELFRGLGDVEVETLSKEVFIHRYGTGEILLREGDVGDHFFLILEGTCAVVVTSSQGTSISVAAVTSGDIVGEMALLAGAPRTATVRASSEVVAARIGKESLSTLLSQRSDLVQAFAHYTALRATEIENAKVIESRMSRTQSGEIDERALGDRIKRFLGLPA